MVYYFCRTINVDRWFFIAYFTTRSIVNPVHGLRKVFLALGKGRFPKDLIKVSNDEIGEMSAALNALVQGMKHTKDFSREVASGNFEYEYHPLSDEDDLGKSLATDARRT